MTITGRCHCGAVRFEVRERPDWLTRCNCSYCRRAGALWLHSTGEKATLAYDPANAIWYRWGDRSLTFVSCRICGCTTHWEGAGREPAQRVAVNCAMSEPAAIAALRVRLFDGADSWRYLD